MHALSNLSKLIIFLVHHFTEVLGCEPLVSSSALWEVVYITQLHVANCMQESTSLRAAIELICDNDKENWEPGNKADYQHCAKNILQ